MKRSGPRGRLEFALADYNCGEGCMDKKVRLFAQDGNLDYWQMLYNGMFNGNAASGYTARFMSAAVLWMAPQEFDLKSPTSDKAIPAFDFSIPVTSLEN